MEFFKYPRKDFHIREIVRSTKISQPSATIHLKELEKQGLIIKEKQSIYPTYKANREDEEFKIYKKFDSVFKIKQSGLLDYLYDTCLPGNIILFGSASKGEDTEDSDIDLFVNCKDKKIDLEKYEKYLKRKISLFFKEDFSKLPGELKNNIINGIILKGYLQVF